jgi:hypothetical protein
MVVVHRALDLKLCDRELLCQQFHDAVPRQGLHERDTGSELLDVGADERTLD